ncbi:class I SAM-dependent methyltransferase [Nocardioides alcanivorans]|uniref:class I SAM-dependent methyltransferase n=1 Tax=Nocardioides alcanivorans TaxID=2897352 RepID=UPI001F3CB835|nr:class I SAM-dependent methyltransferase [Nocardioides alcanivorans]
MASREEMSTSFGQMAGAYEVGRPDYPAESVTWMLEPVAMPGEPMRVADVGAGTGKLTRVAAEVTSELVAIDPDAAMLAQLRETVPGIPTFVGTAEALPLPDASLDAVVLGQAWHWVDPVAGPDEVGRVLRPGGVLGLVWNIRDESEPWVRRLTEVMHGSHAEEMLATGGPTVGPPFGTLEHAEWRWTRPMTRDSLLTMARSRSFVITAPDDVRARIEAGLRELLDEIGAVGHAVIDVPYVTHAYRTLKP